MSSVCAEPITDPTVTIDQANQTITLTVIVTPPAEGSNQFGIAVSPCAVPKGRWTMYWDPVLVGVAAHFASIELPASPLPSGNVTVTESHLVDSSLRWMAVIHNNVELINAFNYTIFVADDNSELITRHDPTIAVVTDPPNG
jgi:hypothetical protein